VGDGIGRRRSACRSTTVTFVALLFWGWAMGALGALLAIPLTLPRRPPSGRCTYVTVGVPSDADTPPELRKRNVVPVWDVALVSG
jgi:hypothetical protein